MGSSWSAKRNGRVVAEEVHVGLVEGLDGPNVLPVALKHVREHPVRVDGTRNDVLPEVRQTVVQQLEENIPVEDVDAHRRQIQVILTGDSERPVLPPVQTQRFQDSRLLGLFNKPGDAVFAVHLEDSQRTRLLGRHGKGRDRQVSRLLDVRTHDIAEIHLVELVTGENQRVGEVIVPEVDQVLSDGISGALVPRRVREGLLRGEDLDETTVEMVELEALRDMPMKRSGIELRQQVHPRDSGVDAVGDWDIDQPILAGERRGGLRTFPGQWKQAGPTTHHEGQDVVHRFSFSKSVVTQYVGATVAGAKERRKL